MKAKSFSEDLEGRFLDNLLKARALGGTAVEVPKALTGGTAVEVPKALTGGTAVEVPKALTGGTADEITHQERQQVRKD